MTPEIPGSSPRPAPNPYEPPSVPSAVIEKEERLRTSASIRFGKRLAVLPPLFGAVASLLPLLVFGPLRRFVNRLPWSYFLLPLDWVFASEILQVAIFFVAIAVMQLCVVRWVSSDVMRFAGIAGLVLLVPACMVMPFVMLFWFAEAPLDRITCWIACIWWSGLFSSVFLASGLGLLRLARARRLHP
jgi:hypothetical protein